MKQTRMAAILVLVSLMALGCRTDSQRLADMADQTVKMQSKQNQLIAEVSRNQSKIFEDIQDERAALNEGFQRLEADRRELHLHRRSELAWSESIRFLAIVLAASMPLILCAFLVWNANRHSSDVEVVNEVLLEELVTRRPRLIAGPIIPDHESVNGEAITSAEH